MIELAEGTCLTAASVASEIPDVGKVGALFLVHHLLDGMPFSAGESAEQLELDSIGGAIGLRLATFFAKDSNIDFGQPQMENAIPKGSNTCRDDRAEQHIAAGKDHIIDPRDILRNGNMQKIFAIGKSELPDLLQGRGQGNALKACTFKGTLIDLGDLCRDRDLLPLGREGKVIDDSLPDQHSVLHRKDVVLGINGDGLQRSLIKYPTPHLCQRSRQMQRLQLTAMSKGILPDAVQPFVEGDLLQRRSGAEGKITNLLHRRRQCDLPQGVVGRKGFITDHLDSVREGKGRQPVFRRAIKNGGTIGGIKNPIF